MNIDTHVRNKINNIFAICGCKNMSLFCSIVANLWTIYGILEYYFSELYSIQYLCLGFYSTCNWKFSFLSFWLLKCMSSASFILFNSVDFIYFLCSRLLFGDLRVNKFGDLLLYIKQFISSRRLLYYHVNLHFDWAEMFSIL